MEDNNKNMEVEEKEEKREMSKTKRAILIALCVLLLAFAAFLIYRGFADIFRPEGSASASVVVDGIDMSVPNLVPMSSIEYSLSLDNGEIFYIHCGYVLNDDIEPEYEYYPDRLMSVMIDGPVGYLDGENYVLLAGITYETNPSFDEYIWHAYTLSEPYLVDNDTAFCELSFRCGDYFNDDSVVFVAFAIGSFLEVVDELRFDINCLSFADTYSEPNTLDYPHANLAYCIKEMEIRSHGSALRDAYYDGYDKGYLFGYDEGSSDGMTEGLEQGYNSGYYQGTTDGYNAGYAEGTEEMEFYCEQNYLQGFHEGQIEGQGNVETLLGSILEAPVNFIKSVFYFEIMGINIASLVLFGITIAIVVFVIRKLRG